MLIGGLFRHRYFSFALRGAAPPVALLITLRPSMPSSAYGVGGTLFSTLLRPAGDFNVNEDG
jgi:hypothetical protein